MDSTDLYYDDIRKTTTLLTRAEETRLFERYHAGDKAAGEKIVTSNLRFVISVARRYASSSSAPIEDLISEGNIGLIRARDKFDPARGNKFISYAVWWIRQRILIYLRENDLVRRPISDARLSVSVLQAHRRLAQALGHEPSHEEVALHAGVDASHVAEVLDAPFRMTYADGITDSETGLPMEVITGQTEEPVAEETVFRQECQAILLSDIRTILTEREQYVIICSFGLDGQPRMTLNDIGKSLNLTRERIRQIKETALAKLKNRPDMRYVNHMWSLST